MSDKMDIQVEHGIGYIKEFNGTLHIGSREKFEPMMKWIKEKIYLNIKSVGKRYAPNYTQYMDINIQNDILLEYLEAIYSISKLKEKIYLYKTEIFSSQMAYNLNDFTEVTDEQIIDFIKLAESLDEENFLINRKNLLELTESIIKCLEQTEKTISDENNLRRYNEKIIELHYFKSVLESKEAFLYIRKVMLLSGEALVGKTHAFCDISLNRLKSDQPTLLFFGNKFDETKTIIENMVSLLGLKPIDEDEFLEALNKWGDEYNTRTLIMIDAINETENPKLWQDGIIKLCEQIKSYPNLALAMSIRDVEKNKIITPSNEEYIANEIVEVEHKGFEGIELEAVRTFCEALKVEFPKVPIHTYQLFVNPGMLFIYIESIKNSTKKVDTSIINPLTLFKNYLFDLERKYYQKYMDEIDEDDETVKEAIKEFIALGTKQDFIHFYLDYKEVKKQLKPLHNKVLEFLISEGVLNKLKNDDSTKVYFTYQKFENFFIADYLLSDYETNKDIIFKLIKEYNGAITEALLMQIPEKLGKEIFDLNVWLIRDQYICEQYLNSLVWRKPSTIDENTFKYINFIMGYEHLQNVFLDTVLQLSTIPHHPLNMIRLHKKLLEFSMPDRDYHWSIYIHNSYREEGIVKRIIHWAWDKKEEFEIDDESLYLYGLTLGWFLTSSNRELRDGTTKALVNLFTDRVDVFLRVLKEFKIVDDLYVTERLYAVGYGIVLRSSVENGFKELGEYLYETVFNQSEVLEHILIRDYAKLTVEYIHKIFFLGIKIDNIYPPYNQHIDWELPTIKKEDVEQYQDDYTDIYWSSLHGDFKIYVVYPKLHHFMNLKIKDRPHPKSEKQRYDEFFDALTPDQKKEYEKIRLKPQEILSILNQARLNEIVKDLKQEKVEVDIQDIVLQTKGDLTEFKKLLSTEQRQEYDDFIINYKQAGRYEKGIDVKSAKRYLFLKVVKMGWRKELFGEFDGSTGSYSRHEHTRERISKKYQWVAFYQLLAKLTDHYEFREESYGEEISNYRGLYQLSFTRNIDPSSILKQKKNLDDIWWFNIDKSFENSKISNKEWMGSVDKLPTIEQCIKVKKEDEEFLVQSLAFSIDGNKDQQSYRNLYYHIDAFVLQKDSLKEFIEWLKTVDYFGQHKLPQSSSLHDMYLREYPEGESFKYLDTYYHGQMDWDDSFDHIDGVMPTQILLTSTSYMNEASSYDKSVSEAIEIKLPNKWFIQEMDLKQTLNDGEWIDKAGNIVFLDPTVHTGGITSYNDNGILVSNKKLLTMFLESRGLTQIWIVWGEKQVRSTKDTRDDKEFLGFSEIMGYGYFDGEEFVEFIKINWKE